MPVSKGGRCRHCRRWQQPLYGRGLCKTCRRTSGVWEDYPPLWPALWPPEAEALLAELFARGRTDRDIAAVVGRSVKAVEQKRWQLRLLRPRGKRGTLLAARIRAEYAAGGVSYQTLADRYGLSKSGVHLIVRGAAPQRSLS